MGSAILQGHLWGGAAYAWAELQEPLSRPLWLAMLDAAGVDRGTHLLDAGCGAGGASVLAGQRGALVNGLDASDALLTIARRRVPDGDFRMGDLELLPYAGHSFDAVIAADVLPYVAQPAVALRELTRVSRDGATVVTAVEAMPPDPVWQAIARALGELLPTAVGEEPFALSAPGVLDTLIARAGLQALTEEEVMCPWEYVDPETAWEAHASTGPLQAAMQLLGPLPVRTATLRALAHHTTAAGTVRLVKRFRYILATPREHEHEKRTVRKESAMS